MGFNFQRRGRLEPLRLNLRDIRDAAIATHIGKSDPKYMHMDDEDLIWEAYNRRLDPIQERIHESSGFRY